MIERKEGGEEEMKINKIQKAYGRKIVRPSDYSSFMFETRLEADIEIKEGEGEKLEQESQKLFDICKTLTEEDIDRVKDEIYPIVVK